MTSYVAFLRGVNLGPTNKIAMPQLRALGEELGYTDVRTYINSGNLLLTTSETASTVAEEIKQAIKTEFGASIDVAVRSEAQLRTILAANPYADANPSQVTVAFLTTSPPLKAHERVAALATEHEPFTFAGDEVWVNYTTGIGNSKLAAQFSKAVGVSATVRNVRTVGKIVALFD